MTRSYVEAYQVPLLYLHLDCKLITTQVAHKIYGIPQTINTANYAYFVAYKELFALRSHVQSQATLSERPQRLIDDTELDRLVTGTYCSTHNEDAQRMQCRRNAVSSSWTRP